MPRPIYRPTTLPQLMGDVRNMLTSGLEKAGYGSLEIDVKTGATDQLLLIFRSGLHQHHLLSRDQARAILRQQAQPLMGDLSFWYRFEEICDRIMAEGHGYLQVDLKPASRGFFSLTLRGSPSYRFHVQPSDLLH
ncbi:MAG: hypothetical protein AAFU71_02670 [Cyanobacteria bacterium J06632_22]